MDLIGQILGGLLVGIGTRLGNGCTSGHGVCGIPRLSIRSIVATITFIAFAMLIASIKYHYPFLNSNMSSYNPEVYYNVWPWFALGIYLLANVYFVIMIALNRKKRKSVVELLSSFVFGLIFGLGLMISGMCRITKISGFLIIDRDRWDPSLMFVMASAVSINLVTF